MTNEELNAIRERTEKATTGPWVSGFLPDYALTITKPAWLEKREDVDIYLRFMTSGDSDQGVIPHAMKIGESEITLAGSEDLAFIEHAREDIPKLLDFIYGLKRQLSELCPIGDLDTINSLLVDKRYATEVIAEKDAEIERLNSGITRLRDRLICDLDAVTSGDDDARSSAYEDCLTSTLRRIDRYILNGGDTDE